MHPDYRRGLTNKASFGCVGNPNPSGPDRALFAGLLNRPNGLKDFTQGFMSQIVHCALV